MPERHLSLAVSTAAQTTQRAIELAQVLTAGDIVLLHGDVGAGKTHFARSLIQSVMPVVEDVPSPTFTLVQSYDTARGDIWHADLYRLTSTYEIEELGLLDAFETAICLIEWPDRLGPLAPENALTLTLTDGPTDDARQITATWQDARWDNKLSPWKT